VNARQGHLFERRYRAILINSDEYLLELVRYIHLNPVRARLVDNPDHYRWSSHGAYRGGACPKWLTTDRVLQVFASSANKAQRRYRDFMQQQPLDGTLARLRAGLSGDDRILGDDSWAERALAKSAKQDIPQSLEELIGEVCRQHGVQSDALTEKARCRKMARLRAQIALRASEQGIATITEVARRFGRAHSGLVRAVNRLRDNRGQVQ
jgi:putative transposase